MTASGDADHAEYDGNDHTGHPDEQADDLVELTLGFVAVGLAQRGRLRPIRLAQQEQLVEPGLKLADVGLGGKADLARYATKDDLAAGLDRLGDRIDRIDQKFTALREQDRIEATAQREQDRIERKSDLRSIKAHHYTVIGFIVALFVANLTIL